MKQKISIYKRITNTFRNIRYLSKFDLRELRSVEKELELLKSINNYALKKDMIYSLENAMENIFYLLPNTNIQKPDILNCEATLDLLLKSNKSIIRFGDGEISLMLGSSIPYQKYDKRLADKMKEVIKNNDEKILVGINWWYFYPSFTGRENAVYRNFVLVGMPHYRTKLKTLINENTKYVDAGISGGFAARKTPERDAYYKKFRTLWGGKDIVLVGCKEAFSKIQNDIFDNAKNIAYLYCPNKNSFDKYDELLAKLMEYPKNKLIILMAGPTSKVLAYDLAHAGYRALDLGHIQKSYDWYSRGNDGKPWTAEQTREFWAPDI